MLLHNKIVLLLRPQGKRFNYCCSTIDVNRKLARKRQQFSRPHCNSQRGRFMGRWSKNIYYLYAGKSQVRDNCIKFAVFFGPNTIWSLMLMSCSSSFLYHYMNKHEANFTVLQPQTLIAEETCSKHNFR